ncbi:unnamed protein product [Rhodiola kirilowii]
MGNPLLYYAQESVHYLNSIIKTLHARILFSVQPHIKVHIDLSYPVKQLHPPRCLSIHVLPNETHLLLGTRVVNRVSRLFCKSLTDHTALRAGILE